MKLRAIVIEDEPLAVKKLESFAEKVSYLELSRVFDNALEAIGYLKANVVDLIFLDIQMEEFTGIQFLETIRQRPRVIVTTAYDQYALKGYELNVCDYLLKPFTFERFLKAVDKVYHEKSENEEPNDSIFIKTEYRLEKIKISEIQYIEGMSEYLRVVTMDKKIMTKLSFKNLEEILPNKNFIRVHKSYVIAIDKIENIERNRIKIMNMLIPIGESYKDSFYKKIGILKS